MEKIPFTLPARCGHPAIAGSLIIESGGISLSFDGYHPTDPVYIEIGGDGHPVLNVWADANQEDPTHQISFRGAHASYWVDPESAL